jgi:predicted TPR repeat methyltransferase
LKTELKEVRQVEELMNNVNQLASSENYQGALSYIQKVLELCPDSIDGRIRLIEYLAKSGNTKMAIQKSSDYLSDLSHNPDFLYIRGLALCYDGQT